MEEVSCYPTGEAVFAAYNGTKMRKTFTPAIIYKAYSQDINSVMKEEGRCIITWLDELTVQYHIKIGPRTIAPLCYHKPLTFFEDESNSLSDSAFNAQAKANGNLLLKDVFTKPIPRRFRIVGHQLMLCKELCDEDTASPCFQQIRKILDRSKMWNGEYNVKPSIMPQQLQPRAKKTKSKTETETKGKEDSARKNSSKNRTSDSSTDKYPTSRSSNNEVKEYRSISGRSTKKVNYNENNFFEVEDDYPQSTSNKKKRSTRSTDRRGKYSSSMYVVDDNSFDGMEEREQEADLDLSNEGKDDSLYDQEEIPQEDDHSVLSETINSDSNSRSRIIHPNTSLF